MAVQHSAPTFFKTKFILQVGLKSESPVEVNLRRLELQLVFSQPSYCLGSFRHRLLEHRPFIKLLALFLSKLHSQLVHSVLERFTLRYQAILGPLVLFSALDTVRCLLLNGVSLLVPEVFQLVVVLKLRLFDSLVDFGFELSLYQH